MGLRKSPKFPRMKNIKNCFKLKEQSRKSTPPPRQLTCSKIKNAKKMNERKILKELYKISFYNWKTLISKFKGTVKCQHNEWRNSHSKTHRCKFSEHHGESREPKISSFWEITDKIDTKLRKQNSSSQKQYWMLDNDEEWDFKMSFNNYFLHNILYITKPWIGIE